MVEQIQIKLIEEEMKESYIDYAMSVITARALPDVNDGLKPVHRRVLYTMYKLGLFHNKAFKKSANVVGTCMARYHPHGDAAIYDTLVRLTQNFSLRYPLADGQGNFGSIDGFGAAAARYTEARLSKIADELLGDIDKKTVKFLPTYDNSDTEPVVLPAKLPNLLINGSSGIAVGMATNIPPHNIVEVIDAIIETIKDSDITIEELMNYIKGPDFPTGGIIVGKQGIKSAYRKGRGRIILRAKTEIEDKNKKRIIVHEIPYQVNKSNLLENIANLVKDKRVTGISDLRDESDKRGLRIVIELKQNANPEVVLNQLHKHSQLQVTFGVNTIALAAGQPKLMNLKEMIDYFILHRRRVVRRRTDYELKKAEDRAHILEGLKIALLNIDAIVKLIKASKNVEVANSELIKNYKLSEKQSLAILDMKLQRLTSLEQNKINEEYDGLLKLIKELKEILASEAKILEIIVEELNELKKKYGDERRTLILDSGEDEVIEEEDLIKEEDIVITISNSGYIKQTKLEEYKQQKRGGKGIIASETKEGDFIDNLFTTSNHGYLLFFTNKGKVHWLKAYQVPLGSRYSKGKAVINLLNLKDDEKVSAVLPVKNFNLKAYLLFCTRNGMIKKTALNNFNKPRLGGIKAITLKEKDELVKVILTPGDFDVVIGTRNGLAVKFNEKDVRDMGRNASGVRGVKLVKDIVVGMEVAKNDADLLTITENGFGKRSEMDEYRLIKRGGKGVINIKTSDRNGKVVGIKTVKDDDEVMFITKNGVTIRTSVKGISKIGRNTQGVRLMKLKDKDKVINVTRIIVNNGV
ncbi:MAG: DNA gyrase subunit A [Nanoarchaeota archaeon]|nr:DNA gyrase subunit A [Nanoarchaeota archaeon]